METLSRQEQTQHNRNKRKTHKLAISITDETKRIAKSQPLPSPIMLIHHEKREVAQFRVNIVSPTLTALTARAKEKLWFPARKS